MRSKVNSYQHNQMQKQIKFGQNQTTKNRLECGAHYESTLASLQHLHGLPWDCPSCIQFLIIIIIIILNIGPHYVALAILELTMKIRLASQRFVSFCLPECWEESCVPNDQPIFKIFILFFALGLFTVNFWNINNKASYVLSKLSFRY